MSKKKDNKLLISLKDFFNPAIVFFINFFTSGTDEKLVDSGVRTKLIFFNVGIILGFITLVFFGISRVAQGEYILASFEIVFAFSLIFFIWLLRKTKKTTFIGTTMVTILFLLILYLVYTGGGTNSGSYWLFAFPVIAITFLGVIGGTIYGTVMLIVSAIMMYFGIHSDTANYYDYRTNVTIGVYLLIFFMFIFSESLKDYFVKKIDSAKKEMEAMKDNLQEGLFLMNSDLKIQENFSKSLLKIFEEDSFEDYTIIDFLQKNNFAQSELEEAEFYLKNYFEDSADDKMDLLRSLNPLENVKVIFGKILQTNHGSHKVGEMRNKYLSFTFTKIRKDGQAFILVTVKDITEETKLKEQIAEEAENNEKEMKVLYNLVNSDPVEMKHFINDSKAEIEEITEMSKRASNNPESLRNLAETIFQKIHSIKGEAAILSIDTLVMILHKAEDYASKMRNKENIEVKDFVEFSIQLKKIIDELHNTEKLTEKLSRHSMSNNSTEKKDILTSKLERAVEKHNSKDVKNIELNIENFDVTIIEDHYRKPLKDIFIQFIRNSFAHGFEERSKGCIEISSKVENDKLVITYKDDGIGLDVNRILEKAKKSEDLKNLDFDNMTEDDIKKLIFKPGFSTKEDVDTGSGRGIGMNIIAEQVRECHGKLHILSEFGKHLTFRMEFLLIGDKEDTKV